MHVTDQKLKEVCDWLKAKAKEETDNGPDTFDDEQQAYSRGFDDGEICMARDILAMLKGQ